jgi:hypothetical protein
MPQTANVDAFFGIAEFFAYRNAQITINVNVLFPCNGNQDRDGSRVSVMESVIGLGSGAARGHRKRVSHD